MSQKFEPNSVMYKTFWERLYLQCCILVEFERLSKLSHYITFSEIGGWQNIQKSPLKVRKKYGCERYLKETFTMMVVSFCARICLLIPTPPSRGPYIIPGVEPHRAIGLSCCVSLNGKTSTISREPFLNCTPMQLG